MTSPSALPYIYLYCTGFTTFFSRLLRHPSLPLLLAGSCHTRNSLALAEPHSVIRHSFFQSVNSQQHDAQRWIMHYSLYRKSKSAKSLSEAVISVTYFTPSSFCPSFPPAIQYTRTRPCGHPGQGDWQRTGGSRRQGSFQPVGPSLA